MRYVAVAGFLFLAGLCRAVPVTYTLQGTVSGTLTLNGSAGPAPFTNAPITVTFSTDTDRVTASNGFILTDWVDGAMVTVNGVTGTFSTAVNMSVYNSDVDLAVQTSKYSYFFSFGGRSPALATYDMKSSLGPLGLQNPTANVYSPTHATSFGGFTVTSVSRMSFTVTGLPPAYQPLTGTTVVAVTGAPDACWSSFTLQWVYGFTFTLNQALDHVTISAPFGVASTDMGGTSHPTGAIYLTRSLGGGATVGDVVASFDMSSLANEQPQAAPPSRPIFQDLSLAAGTYDVTFAETSSFSVFNFVTGYTAVCVLTQAQPTVVNTSLGEARAGTLNGLRSDNPGNAFVPSWVFWWNTSFSLPFAVELPAPPSFLTVGATHAGDFLRGQAGAAYTVQVGNAAGWAATSGGVTVTENLPPGLALVSMAGAGWSCAGATCTRSDALAAGSSYPPITVTVNVAGDAAPLVANQVSVAGGASPPGTVSDVTNVGGPPAPASLSSPANGASGLAWPSLVWSPAAGADVYDVYLGTAAPPPLVETTASTSYTPLFLVAGATYFWQVVARNSEGATASGSWSFTTATSAAGLLFVPVTPCRVVDTRNAAGPFGGPPVGANSARSFAIAGSACGIPASARAYSLNVTAVPQGSLPYLTLWPTGQPQPGVSTLNSFGGTVAANAAIVPAGDGGAVSLFAADTADVILDINGYFDTSNGANSLAFYPAPPCRVADTRGPAGQFGGPSMGTGQSRDFPIPLGGCGTPATSRAYALNVTAVPEVLTHFLGYLSTWPTGQTAPLVSTLNSWTGKVVANAAIVPAGTNESISVFVTDPTDVILDINGTFAAPGTNGLSFYPVAPCRVADTRNPDGPFGGPAVDADATRSFPIPASGCGIPASAAAYSLNVTVVPQGGLPFLTAWSEGSLQPGVSTLNSFDGTVVANAAIVPAGTGGGISVFAAGRTHVILDINGYFAP